MEELVKDFVQVSVEESFALLSEDKIYGRVFYEAVYGAIERRTGFKRDLVRDVYHPVSWGVLTKNDSPFKIEFEGPSEDSVIKPREGILLPEASELSEKIVEEYGETIKGKFEKWRVDPNTYLSQA